MTNPSEADENFTRGSIYRDNNNVKMVSVYWQLSYIPHTMQYVFYNENIMFVFLEVRRFEGIYLPEVHYQDETGTYLIEKGNLKKLNDIHYNYMDIILQTNQNWF